MKAMPISPLKAAELERAPDRQASAARAAQQDGESSQREDEADHLKDLRRRSSVAQTLVSCRRRDRPRQSPPFTGGENDAAIDPPQQQQWHDNLNCGKN